MEPGFIFHVAWIQNTKYQCLVWTTSLKFRELHKHMNFEVGYVSLSLTCIHIAEIFSDNVMSQW